MSFVEKLPEVWQEKWGSADFESPSIIQERSFDLLLEKEDLLGISPTGSGKTLAYLLPLLLNVKKGEGNQLLILLSSQELAVQVGNVASDWAKEIGLNAQTIIGGANTARQVEKLKARPEIIVGTPGRVFELIKAKKIKVMSIETIVMDEVDQLFADEGANITESIVNYAPKEFQLVFFSATGNRVKGRAGMMSGDNLFVIDVTDEDTSSGVVQHNFLKISARKRVDVLRSFAHMDGMQAIVFFNQLSELGSAEEKLLYAGLPVTSLASDQNKALRKVALEKFAAGEVKLLLTTDILARGLDFKNIPYVVNFDVPLTVESYTHRAGRVGRMGASGDVLTFVQDSTVKDYKKIINGAQKVSSEVYLYGGKLVDELPEKAVEVASPVKKGITAKVKPVKTAEDTPKAKKAKLKKKNKKNKGAPKGKKNKD
ncbi:MAG: DEAD/DEAH box helicase [Lactobacillales bacterium]|jgi:superfamily II DNA/RNA helicase|nr:DEAD/DEAH box helicase [Lactobacillales bacterium]